MTDVDSIPAGAVLDLAVHLVVMGLPRPRTIPALAPGEIRLVAGSVNVLEDWTPDPPAYSTDIALAWEVVDRIRALPDPVRFRFADALPDRVGTDDPGGLTAQWPLALLWLTPRTICVAALRAMAP